MKIESGAPRECVVRTNRPFFVVNEECGKKKRIQSNLKGSCYSPRLRDNWKKPFINTSFFGWRLSLFFSLSGVTRLSNRCIVGRRHQLWLVKVLINIYILNYGSRSCALAQSVPRIAIIGISCTARTRWWQEMWFIPRWNETPYSTSTSIVEFSTNNIYFL